MMFFFFKKSNLYLTLSNISPLYNIKIKYFAYNSYENLGN